MCIRDSPRTQAPTNRAAGDLDNGPAAFRRIYERKLDRQYRPMGRAESSAPRPMVWSSMGSPLPATMQGLRTLALRTSSSHQNS
eukprot:11502407-Alexandrium_andersonii.AAC.1